jgi:lysyl-tRNA synthetase class 2
MPDDELVAVRGVVERWRDGPDERGFSMALSRAADVEADPDVVVVTATAEGELAPSCSSCRGVRTGCRWT